jgi:ClpP class serine protease
MVQSEIDRIEALRAQASQRITALEVDPDVLDVDAAAKEDDALDIVDGVALIKIEGILTPKRIRWLDWFDEKQTVYSEIEAKVREAEARGAQKIVFSINSPGGDLEGLYDAMATIASASIPTETVSGYLLASGAYMLASQTDKITAQNDVSLVGSVGVATSRMSLEFIKDIANTDSPKKRPDVSTEEGVKAVQEELDDIYQVLAEQIAEGRNTSVRTVKRDYGEGAVMTARTALQRKMIDAIGIAQPTTAKKAATTGVNMDAKTLRGEHRETFDAVFEMGRRAEREQVCAHLVLAEGSGDFKAAHQAIKDGEGVTQLVVAHHQSAAMRRQHINARQEDNPPPVNAGGEAPPTDETSKIKAEMEADCEGLAWEEV